MIREKAMPQLGEQPITPAYAVLLAKLPPLWSRKAEQICPYSKATRGNIDVAFNLV
jgi:organic hydroperoxide reductase OsmC/OhrA